VMQMCTIIRPACRLSMPWNRQQAGVLSKEFFSGQLVLQVAFVVAVMYEVRALFSGHVSLTF
jgi:hypothetical protein